MPHSLLYVYTIHRTASIFHLIDYSIPVHSKPTAIMSGYEVEHNIQPPKNDANSQSSHRHMPDLSTFFSRLSEVDTTGPNTPHNAHSVPTPGDVASTYRLLADAYGLMLRDVNPGGSNSNDNATPLEPAQQGLLEQMFESLMSEAEMPPRELKGVPDSFLDELERVPKAKLQKTDACPICAEPFLDGALSSPNHCIFD